MAALGYDRLPGVTHAAIVEVLLRTRAVLDDVEGAAAPVEVEDVHQGLPKVMQLADGNGPYLAQIALEIEHA
eukprot:11204132-Lingulodinium_polyedra.AAC.1